MDILETDAFDRRQRRNTSCALLLSLLPFFLASGLYFYLWTHDASPSVVAAGVKAAPTFLLAVVVLGWNGGRSLLGVAGGLLFSMAGDCCLIWPELFIHGMAAFIAAHIQYSLTFLSTRYAVYSSTASKTCSRLLTVLLFLLGSGMYGYLYPYLQREPESGLLTPAVAVYIGILALMGTLAIQTRYVATALGSLCFIVSDLMLSLQTFKVMPATEEGHHVVMVTYYLAQLLIAVGDVRALDYTDNFKWKKT